MADVVGQVIGCHSNDEWKELFEKGKQSKKLFVVDFTAVWCPPCRFIAPILAEFAKKWPHVIFLKVDVDELKDVAEEYEIHAMPTFLFFKEGKVVHTIVGADKDGLGSTIAKLSVEDASAAASSTS